jgi:predicted NAD/FAD-binding protein
MEQVAVIGSGISGMGAAFLLSKHYHVTLYEKNAVPGGHARTLTIRHGDRLIDVDTGFIVFNHQTYPNFLGLLRTLEVATQPSDMSFAFSSQGGKLEWGARNLNAVFGQRRNLFSPRFYAMIADVRRFFRDAQRIVSAHEGLALGELLELMRLGKPFREHFLLPMGAAIWSCPSEQMLAFPAQSFVQFFANHGLLSFSGQHQWYTVSGGSRTYVEKILRPVQRVRLDAPVAKVMRQGDKQLVITRDGSGALYDKVVIAAHADEALSMLDAPTAQEQTLLSAFTYQENEAWLHCDTSAMPRHRACWSSWNYAAHAGQQVSVTYWMNLLQSIDRRYPLFVTLNPVRRPQENKVFNVHRFTHPVFTREAMAAQQQLHTIQGKRNLWFCGAYQRYGFHEDGLASAVAVAQHMGASVPWD